MEGKKSVHKCWSQNTDTLSLEKLVLQKYYNKDGCILQIALLSIADTLSIKGRPCTQ